MPRVCIFTSLPPLPQVLHRPTVSVETTEGVEVVRRDNLVVVTDDLDVSLYTAGDPQRQVRFALQTENTTTTFVKIKISPNAPEE